MAKKVITSGYDPSSKSWMPVYDEDAHTKLGTLSGDLSSHSANSAVHITDEERNGWNQKLDDLSSSISSHTSTTAIHITDDERSSWNAKLDASEIENYYKKTETSSSNEIATALDGKEDTITFGYDEEDRINTINGSAVGGAVYSAGSGIDAAQFDNHIIQLDQEYQPAGNYVSSTVFETATATLSNAITAVGEGLDNLTTDFTAYTATNAGPIASGVAASAWIENFTPTSPLSGGDYIDITDDVVSVTGLDTIISGSNGISAKWNTETSAWDVKLEKEEIAYARYTTNAVLAGTEDADVVIDGLNEEEMYGDKITTNSDSITLQPGLYHADVKLMLQVTTPVAEYKSVKLVAGFTPNRSTEIDLDCSYVHNESICLSFDAMVSEEANVNLSINGLPAGVGYALSYFNIHEIVNVAGLLSSAQTDIVAGDGLSKNGNELAVKLGGGLKFGNNKELTIAVGNGLKISQSELTTDLELVLDDIAEETVEQVQEMQNDLDEKVTTTYAYANITGYSDMSQYGATTGQGVLIRYLFSVPIKNAVYVRGKNAEENGKVTTVGVYASQSYTQNKIILGIYEYDPEYTHSDGTKGRTIALCDTGGVTLKAGFNEFEMINFNKWEETTPNLKSSCIYYAAIYVSKNPGTGIDLATCPGYDTTFNANPQLTCDQSNVGFNLSTEAEKNTTLSDMGWGNGAYHELPQCPRVFMQFRNKKIDV